MADSTIKVDSNGSARIRFCAAAIICALSAGLWVWGHEDLPFMFVSGDERNYAEIARRIATGRGFTTGLIFPIEAEWGVNALHPSILRPPLWPLVLAGAFTIGPATEASAHMAVGFCFVITCLLAFSIGARLAGNLAGFVAGAATATTSYMSTYAMLAGTEMFLALWIALIALLLVCRANAFWVGVVCGLAYLTRYNAGLLLVASLLFLPMGTPRWKPHALCLGGFILVGTPWWLRNFMVTGDPFYSLYTATLWAEPGVVPGSVLSMLEPPGVVLAHPLLRAYEAVPSALLIWPVPAANLLAFGGLLLGCVYLSRPHLAIASAYFLSKLAITFVVIRSRYLIPFIPAVISLGSAAWVIYGGRFGKVALGLILLMPLAPTIPVPDVFEGVMNQAIAQARERERSHGDASVFILRDMRALTTCMDATSVVITSDATASAWFVDNIAIQMPQSEEDFWRLADAHSVDFIVGPARDRLSSARFLETFARRPDCGPSTFERRS